MRIFEYNYVHSATEGTTGYFACAPDFEAGWPNCLALLAQRPGDQWLWEHALAQFALLGAEERKAFIENCGLAEGKRASDGINLQFLRFWRERATSDGARARLIEICRIANAAIHKHVQPGRIDWAALELPRPELTPEKAWPGRLRGGRESGPRQWQDPRQSAALKRLASLALVRLEAAGLLEGPEMRHEASLSPIALLRGWRLESFMLQGSAPWRLRGAATAYGKGLSLAAARVSCLMEIVERASAHARIAEDGSFIAQEQLGALRLAGPEDDVAGVEKGENSLFCVPAQNSAGQWSLVPARDVFLFINLPDGRGLAGSTGLAAGASMAGARLAALTEVLERHAHASMPHDPARCFTPASRDSLLQSLLDDYRARGIFVFLEDITCENGLPAYRCFVEGRDGRIAQATGAGLNGREAALSALLECPWPYQYSQPAPFGRPSARPAAFPPRRFLEALPDYSTGGTESDLRLLEAALGGSEPLYVDLTRADLGFPVTRCLVYGLETTSDFDPQNPPGPRLLARLAGKRQ